MAKTPTCFFDIPDDIVIEVLSGLPLKTVAIFACVSKRLQYLFSPSITKTNTKVLAHPHLKNSWHNIFSLHKISQDTFFESVYSYFEIYSSYNGLLLVRFDVNLFVWNPLTKFFKRVLICDRLKYNRYKVVGGLCSSSAYEYKVVLAMYPRKSSDEGFVIVSTCGISRWERIDFPCYVRTVRQGPVFKGYIHWLCSEDGSVYHPRDQIVYFDPISDKFIVVPTPQCTDTYWNYWERNKDYRDKRIFCLGVLDGCLCMPRWYEDNVEILVMKKYGIENSWETLFTISFSSVFDCYVSMQQFWTISHCFSSTLPLFRTNDDELYIPLHMDIKALVANGNFSRTTPISLPDGKLEVIVHEESLISPAGNNWDKFNPEWFALKWYEHLYLTEFDKRWSSYEDSNLELTDLEDSGSYAFEWWCRKREARRKNKKHKRKRKHRRCNFSTTIEIKPMKSQRENTNSI